MKFHEAMNLLCAGEKVRPIFPGNETIFISRNCDFLITKATVNAEWELYQEPVLIMSFQDVVKGNQQRNKT